MWFRRDRDVTRRDYFQVSLSCGSPQNAYILEQQYFASSEFTDFYTVYLTAGHYPYRFIIAPSNQTLHLRTAENSRIRIELSL